MLHMKCNGDASNFRMLFFRRTPCKEFEAPIGLRSLGSFSPDFCAWLPENCFG